MLELLPIPDIPPYPTFAQAEDMLDELVFELPAGIFEGLNCGVSLIQDTIYGTSGLLTLGCYHYEPRGLGRYITIHYGSMVQAFGHLSHDRFRAELKDVLHHELTHHIEHMAGDKTLELEDERTVARLLGRR